MGESEEKSDFDPAFFKKLPIGYYRNSYAIIQLKFLLKHAIIKTLTCLELFNMSVKFPETEKGMTEWPRSKGCEIARIGVSEEEAFMKTVITIQHTQAVHHLNGRVGSWTDWELSDLGKAHAKNIGKRLAAELSGKPCKIYCSDLIRVKQTAEPLARYLGLSVEYRSELREHYVGADGIGKSREWMSAHASPIVTIDDRPFPDGESGRDVYIRLKAFCDEITASPDDNIVVAHGMCLSVFFAVWHRWDAAMFEMSDFSGAVGGVSWMCENESGMRIIRRLNDMSYLEG